MKVISGGVTDVEIRSGFQDVTPAMATTWLERNTNNRGVSDARVHQLAEAMRRGEWRLTHQGLAFGADGSLYDGQHRLWAIIHSGVTVTLMVTTGLHPDTRANIDGQRTRTVADNFAILSGTPHAKKMVELANVVQMLITGESAFKGTYDQTVEIVERFKSGISWALELPGSTVRLGAAPIRGAMAFAYKTNPAAVTEFAEQVMLGANLAVDAPAFVLRNSVLSSQKQAKDRREVAVRTLRAALAHIHGETLRSLYATEDSVAFFGVAHGLKLTASSVRNGPNVLVRRAKAKAKAARG